MPYPTSLHFDPLGSNWSTGAWTGAALQNSIRRNVMSPYARAMGETDDSVRFFSAPPYPKAS